MKNLAIVLLLAVSIALGALTFRQKQQLADTHTRLVAGETRLQAQAATIESARAAASRAKMLEAALKESAAAAGEQTKQQTRSLNCKPSSPRRKRMRPPADSRPSPRCSKIRR